MRCEKNILITFEIISDKIYRYGKCVYGSFYRGKSVLKNVSIFCGQKPLNECLYIMLERQYSENNELYSKVPILILKENISSKIEYGNAIVIESSINIIDLYNYVMNIFNKFYDWREEMYRLALEHSKPKDFIECSYDFFEAELGICNRNYKMEAFTAGYNKTVYSNENIEEKLQDMRNLLNTDKVFVDSFNTREISDYPWYTDCNMFYYNIFHEEEYLTRIIVLYDSCLPGDGIYRLFSYLVMFLEEYYQYSYEQMKYELRDEKFVEMIEDLVKGKSVDNIELEQNLKKYSWNFKDIYKIMRLTLDSYPGNSISRNYFCAQIETEFSQCCTIQIQEDIICVINVSAGDSNEIFQKKLSIFLRENLCKAGISNELNGIKNIYMLVEEASDALKYGRIRNQTFWYYKFSDYYVDYLKDICIKKYELSQLQHTSVLILKEYDSTNNTELYNTLKVYSQENFSATATANRLFIHRSTLLHRIERIQKLTKIDFADKDIRQKIMLSYFLDD